MAPPANRRSGFSRRAQYSTFLSYIAGAIGAVVGLGLVVISIANPGAFSGLRGAAADVTEPAAKATAAGRTVSKTVVNDIAGFFKFGSEHARLERELAEAKVRLVEADAIRAENKRLKQLLDLTRSDEGAIATARLTSSTSGSTRRYATLDAGRDKGLTKGMPIRSKLGLVGRILEVGASTSRVLLITDTESLVPVRRSTDGVPAFAQGNGDGTLRIRLINLGINPLKKGDVMVTSGSGGLYRPGTPMAILTEIVRDGAVARVLSNPSDTDYVMIEKVWTPKPPPPAHENSETFAE
ncbi:MULTISPECIES: rod shape-determining protein MreC [Novosphingobium]|uniref:Cell shape-determining protein MreC n=1 Tax=Novosphingobium mathurense TaxID=428990 RepID=A0A1U6GWN9_9SPHN|nr:MULTISPECIES: rod shape-determining protein MreC [Novosphingobium]CDO34327.1 Rod shape-determining protein [Novosphingobium sp. KN65.2]SLJ87945.1 rod shape-determining protein MreC [Novosphingobium mathurense]